MSGAAPGATGAPVGVLGLGLMGLPVARNLAAAGVPVRAWNRRDVELGEPGPGAAGGSLTLGLGDEALAAIGASCPVVLSLLPDLPPLEALLPTLLGEGHAVRTLVVMSTVSPVAVAQLGRELAAQRIDVVDAPMSGGVAGAQAATLSIMIGGAAEPVARVLPLLQSVGTTVVHLGDLGAGSLTKACNQMVVAGTLAALTEATVLAERSGLDRGAVLDILAGGLAASEVLRQKRDALVTDDFTPSGPARYLLKDLRFATDAAAGVGTHLPQLGLSQWLLELLVKDGDGDLDTAALLDVVRRISRS